MDLFTYIFFLYAAFIIAASLLALYWFGAMILPIFFNGAPYVPTPHERVKKMIKRANITSSDVVSDLGSGDGRLLIAAAKAGAKRCIGYELHPSLVSVSRSKAKNQKLDHIIEVFKTSFWNANLKNVSLVLLYQIPHNMQELEDKLRGELPKGARVVSNGFEFPKWKPKSSEDRIHLYIN